MDKQSAVVIGIWVLGLVLLSILLPGLIVDKRSTMTGADRANLEGEAALTEAAGGQHMDGIGESPFHIPVYLTGENRVEHVPLEAYVRGVVAAEMPPEFELEALKAQAIAARTYIVRRMVDGDFSQVPVEGAWVTDSIVHQAYATVDQLQSRWGNEAFRENWNKITQAVRETKGQILTYDGAPIQAAYFSTSNGYTENAEDYWQHPVPYLRSVPSPWDEQLSPRYKQLTSFSADEFMEKLEVSTLQSAASEGAYRVLERTVGGRVKSARIGDRILSGREIREKLALPSTHFTFRITGQKIEATTYGYGHGIGMSQYGAQGMALEGHTAKQILQYYYQGVEMAAIDQALDIEPLQVAATDDE